MKFSIVFIKLQIIGVAMNGNIATCTWISMGLKNAHDTSILNWDDHAQVRSAKNNLANVYMQ